MSNWQSFILSFLDEKTKEGDGVFIEENPTIGNLANHPIKGGGEVPKISFFVTNFFWVILMNTDTWNKTKIRATMSIHS